MSDGDNKFQGVKDPFLLIENEDGELEHISGPPLEVIFGSDYNDEEEE